MSISRVTSDLPGLPRAAVGRNKHYASPVLVSDADLEKVVNERVMVFCKSLRSALMVGDRWLGNIPN